LAYSPTAGRWEVALWGNNLTDEEYFDSVSIGGTGIRGGWGRPRTYGIDFSYNF
jgi:iron complex outermembrane recepter protein